MNQRARGQHLQSHASFGSQLAHEKSIITMPLKTLGDKYGTLSTHLNVK